MNEETKPESGHCSDRGYRVEVRATRRSINYSDRVYIGPEWGELPVVHPEPHPVANWTATADERDRLTRSHSYYGAIALAASFLDHLPSFNSHGAEVRIVEYKRSTDYAMERLEERPLPDEIDEIFARAGLADRIQDSDRTRQKETT